MITEELTTRIIEQLTSRFYGKYRGRAAETADPLNRGRIKAIVPEVLGSVTSGWCTPCVPYAGADTGWFVIPEVGDGVWIEFEAGDPSRPIWSGSWFGDGDAPNDPDGSPATPQTKIYKSATGLTIDLDDAAHEIKISDGSGSNIITIGVDAGKIVIQAAANVTVEAPVINLVDRSMHPVVLGDNLLQYLNQLVVLYQTHVHPGERALGVFPVTPSPPVPPFPPATPALLSTKVFTG